MLNNDVVSFEQLGPDKGALRIIPGKCGHCQVKRALKTCVTVNIHISLQHLCRRQFHFPFSL